MNEVTQKDLFHKVTCKQLFFKYKDWCQENGESSVFRNIRNMNSFLKEKGFEIKVLGQNKSYVIGLRCFDDDSG